MLRTHAPAYPETVLSTMDFGCKLDAKLRPVDLCRHDDYFLILLHEGYAFRKQIAPKVYGDDYFSFGPTLNILVC